MGHPDFRVRGKIFATLFTRNAEQLGMVKLSPAEQRQFMATDPDAFEPCSGAWGRRGATQVRLDAVDAQTLRSALHCAWLNTAPKGLLNESSR